MVHWQNRLLKDELLGSSLKSSTLELSPPPVTCGQGSGIPGESCQAKIHGASSESKLSPETKLQLSLDGFPQAHLLQSLCVWVLSQAAVEAGGSAPCSGQQS